MIKLKIISFFLILLIALQMLPIAQIGNMLNKNQWTEELPHNASDNSGKFDADGDFHHPFLPHTGFSATISFSSESKTIAYILFLDQIPPNHSAEIVIPPPDFVS